MEILDLIENLEDYIDKAITIPIINRALIDKDELLDFVQDLRLRLPEDLKQAKWIKEERKRIMAEAQNEAGNVIKKAEEKTTQLVNEHEITKKAYEQANEIIAQAQRNAREIRQGTREYAESMLADIEQALVRAVEEVRAGKSEMKK